MISVFVLQPKYFFFANTYFIMVFDKAAAYNTATCILLGNFVYKNYENRAEHPTKKSCVRAATFRAREC